MGNKKTTINENHQIRTTRKGTFTVYVQRFAKKV